MTRCQYIGDSPRVWEKCNIAIHIHLCSVSSMSYLGDIYGYFYICILNCVKKWEEVGNVWTLGYEPL